MKSFLRYIAATAVKTAKAWNGPLTFLSVLIAVSAGYIAFLDWRVDHIIRDPAFLQDIARRVRPALVLNADGAVITDSGALDMLTKAPEVTMISEDKGLAFARIVLRPKRLISEPILESLDVSNVSVIPKRLPGIDWELTVVARFESISSQASPAQTSPARFRIELSSN